MIYNEYIECVYIYRERETLDEELLYDYYWTVAQVFMGMYWEHCPQLKLEPIVYMYQLM